MKKNRSVCCFLVLGLLAGGASGCGAREETESVKSPYAGAVSMEGTPVVDYAVPQLLPNILVNTRGYLPEDKKTAAVKGSSIPELFRLVDAVTGETVYTGAIEDAVYNAEQGLYSGTADFSQVESEGTYYLECDRVGQSYRFMIQEQLYQELFEENCEQLIKKCGERTLTLPEAIALLEAYEWYTGIFPDEDGDEVPDVLTELKGWVAYIEENGAETREEALYAALLAKFSYLYQKFDHEYATDCLKRASTVFGQVQTTISKDADAFFALTELYRATGLSTYRKQITDYKSFFENNSSYMEETEYLYAIMTYMATRQKVDVELCETFMGNLMDRAEELSMRYADMIHPVTAKNNGSEELLECAVELSCANYVMNNYQYTKITEEFLHYLMGRNLESVSFYARDEDRTGYVLLLAQLAANHSDE